MVSIPHSETRQQQRAALYLRVSTAAQEEEGTSLTTQEERCRQYALAHGYRVDEAHVYREVHTGTELWERPQLSRLRDAVRRGMTDVVIAYAIDRLSRDPVHLGVVISEAEHAGVDVQFVTEPLDNSPEGQLIRFVRGYAAKVEHEKIKERSMRGKLARARSGRLMPGGRPRYGYRWADDSKSKYVIDEPKAAIVRRIFEAAAAGTPMRVIACNLNDERIPSPRGKSTGWYGSTVHLMLIDRGYTGDAVAFRYRNPTTGPRKGWGIRPASEHIPLPPGTVPAIVDEATFEAVQARMKLNKEQAARNNANPKETLLRGGIVRCGYCGHASHAYRNNRTGYYLGNVTFAQSAAVLVMKEVCQRIQPRERAAFS